MYMIRLYNTLTKSVDPFVPLRDDGVRMYSCGPTVYDVAHIGNMRAFLFPDVLQRMLRVIGGYPVHWVMNVTDIDDKTIRDSAVGSPRWRPEMGEQTADPLENLRRFTSFFTQEFLADLGTFGIDVARVVNPRATDYIAQMQQLTRDILAAGYAYVSDGSVYFNVAAYSAKHTYGRLFTIDTQNFREGVRIDADEYDRESVSDFVLWKGQKDGEPAWDFEIDGQNVPGRPGWHIECSAMSQEILGLPFDIHTGGVDLRFPHHEDELAQCTAGYHVHDQAAFWMHNEFLEVEGKKMSKSLGNFYTMRDLVNSGVQPLDVRFAMLQAHYRAVFNFTFDGVAAARTARAKVQDYVYDIVEAAGDHHAAASDGVGRQLLDAVGQALADDVHTPRALAALFVFMSDHPARSLAAADAASVLDALRAINDVLAVVTIGARPAVEIPADIRELAEQRWSARTAKNWAESDRLRDELTARGWTMKDGKDGYTLEPVS